MQLSYSFSNSTLSSPSRSSLPPSPPPPPPPPPPSPNDTLLDITPRKSSLSIAIGMSASCAFPSWPNRSSLLSADSDSVVSSYLSDEDLFPAGTPSSSSVNEELGIAVPVIGVPDLTIEEQIQMIRAAAEEDEQRGRFLAHVHAHARAQEYRAAQLAAAKRENAKRRPVVEKKRTSSPTKNSSS
ncbi:hypothetical protein Egran_05368 [Elaphomyces granulatus]|uniref:Uncharacterized protein n=1 Tax=Elaphomyces granulatus TaxID=519963 RepID=A0A232LRS8_9EURO|nr:hypothetical protein Egran_05368 [Elaphomyces granulatus]